jgi:hypothetical protein
MRLHYNGFRPLFNWAVEAFLSKSKKSTSQSADPESGKRSFMRFAGIAAATLSEA